MMGCIVEVRAMEGVDVMARVAALVAPGDDSHDFIETVLCNAGMPIRLFRGRDEAMKYLSSE